MAGLRLAGLRHQLIAPLDLTLAPGELVFLSGPSGSGKSLLLRAIADLDPHEGEVWLGGESRSQMAAPLWRRRVGLLPAESAWWAETVGEHLPMVSGQNRAWWSLTRPMDARIQPHRSTTAMDPIRVWLDQLGFPADVLEWNIARLSTGERQRLALVRLLAQGPEVLLLDEASANLDPVNRERVEHLVDDYRRVREAPVLWVSHDPEQRHRLGGRSLVIRDGHLKMES